MLTKQIEYFHIFMLNTQLPPRESKNESKREISWNETDLWCNVSSWRPQSLFFLLNISSDPYGSAPPDPGCVGGGRKGSNKRFLQSIWICSLQGKQVQECECVCVGNKITFLRNWRSNKDQSDCYNFHFVDFLKWQLIKLIGRYKNSVFLFQRGFGSKQS